MAKALLRLKRGLGASILLAAASIVAAASAERPIEQFAHLPSIKDPAISPDGQKIAARIAIDGKEYLTVQPIIGAGEPVLLQLSEGELNWFRWVNDQWLIASVGNALAFGQYDVYVRRSVGISTDGKQIVRLGWTKAGQIADNLIWTAHDGSPRVLMAMQQRDALYADTSFWPSVQEVDV